MITSSRVSSYAAVFGVAALLHGAFAGSATAPLLTVAAREPLATEALSRSAPSRRHKSIANVHMLLYGGSAGASTAATASYDHTRTRRLLGLSPRALEGLKNGVASGLATIAAKSALQPFDAIKTVQQGHAGVAALSMTEALADIVQRAGVGALYSGLSVSLVGSLPAVFVYFSAYQFLKAAFLAKWCPGGYDPMSPVRSSSDSDSGANFRGYCAAVLAAAGCGNFLASFLRPPYEIVKQRLQAGKDGNVAEAIGRILAEDGLSGFWRGLRAQMARDIPYAMVTLLTYELLRQAAMRAKLLKEGGRDSDSPSSAAATLSPIANALLGGLAGGVGSFCTNPMDVVMTRINLASSLLATTRGGGEAQSSSGSSVVAVALEILQSEGLGAFGKGVGPRLAHKGPANAVFFLVYELCRALLGVGSAGSRQ